MGSSRKLGLQLAKNLKNLDADVLLIGKNHHDKNDIAATDDLVNLNNSFFIALDGYEGLPELLANILKNDTPTTIIYFLSTGGKTTFTACNETVIRPITDSLQLQCNSEVNHIYISSQLSFQIGFEKSLVYHMEKSTLETVFKYYAIRSNSRDHRFNIIRLSHLVSEYNKIKYSQKAKTLGLVNIPNRSLELPDIDDFTQAIRFIGTNRGINGLILNLDQGGSLVSATSERSGYTERL